MTKRLLDGISNAGRSEVINACEPPTTFPNAVTLVNLEGDDEASEFVTVYLWSTRENKEVTPNPSFRPYLVAMVEWGTAGFQHQAEVDFADGMSFSLSCSYLRVKVKLDETAFVGVNPVPNESIRVGATCSYGTRPGALAPIRTLYMRNVLPAALSTPVQIPPFTRTLTLLFNVYPVTPQHHLIMLDSQGNVVATRQINSVGVGTSDVPVPGDARSVQVFNRGGALATDFRVVCALAF